MHNRKLKEVYLQTALKLHIRDFINEKAADIVRGDADVDHAVTGNLPVLWRRKAYPTTVPQVLKADMYMRNSIACDAEPEMQDKSCSMWISRMGNLSGTGPFYMRPQELLSDSSDTVRSLREASILNEATLDGKAILPAGTGGGECTNTT